jgi:hypothetical protein
LCAQPNATANANLFNTTIKEEGKEYLMQDDRSSVIPDSTIVANGTVGDGVVPENLMKKFEPQG